MFWQYWVSVAMCRASVVVVLGDNLHCGAQAFHCGGFSCCTAQALGMLASVVVVRGLSCPEACGILQTRDQTRIPCIGRQILNHWTTREVQRYVFGSDRCCFIRKDLLRLSGRQFKHWKAIFIQPGDELA